MQGSQANPKDKAKAFIKRLKLLMPNLQKNEPPLLKWVGIFSLNTGWFSNALL